MKNKLSANAITRTIVVTMMVRKENEPNRKTIRPITHRMAMNGVAATSTAPQKERSDSSAISEPSAKP